MVPYFSCHTNGPGVECLRVSPRRWSTRADPHVSPSGTRWDGAQRDGTGQPPFPAFPQVCVQQFGRQDMEEQSRDLT